MATQRICGILKVSDCRRSRLRVASTILVLSKQNDEVSPEMTCPFPCCKGLLLRLKPEEERYKRVKNAPYC